MQDTEVIENSSDHSQKTSEIAMRHLEEVISQVVNEAIEYAEKPPEERTLPVITRKAPPPKPRPQITVVNPNNGLMAQQAQAVANLQHAAALSVAQPFTAMKGQNIPQMVSFNSVVQSTPQMVMQYNGQYSNQMNQTAQLQQQYAQQFQLQQQQYQNPAFAHMQQIQQVGA
ncbi:hypothetical protein Ciccas_003375 [Cichlidogyrus casuarinus]|uniref:Uncharacterized protein n=1 Tax=Cichlidogyrus casuarinus TaxID=1844966 RepID=A0ABD2QEI5_9PLAT